MDSRNIDLYVKILLEIDEIELRKKEYGITSETWHASRALRDLLLMPLIQIGEITTQFKDSSHLRDFPDLPWLEIKGFRNVVVHGYGQIDIDIAWSAATQGVEELREGLRSDKEILDQYECEKAFLSENDVAGDSLSQLIGQMPAE